MSPYRIVLVVGHMILRQVLKTILFGKKDFEVIGEADDDLHLLGLLTTCKIAPQMIILAHPLSNLDGSEALRNIKIVCPDAKVLIVSMHRDKGVADYFVSLGAEGYLIQTDLLEELFPAIEKVRQGGVYIPPFPSGSANGYF